MEKMKKHVQACFVDHLNTMLPRLLFLFLALFCSDVCVQEDSVWSGGC